LRGLRRDGPPVWKGKQWSRCSAQIVVHGIVDDADNFNVVADVWRITPSEVLADRIALIEELVDESPVGDCHPRPGGDISSDILRDKIPPNPQPLANGGKYPGLIRLRAFGATAGQASMK
jgi:hypothetical protein